VTDVFKGATDQSFNFELVNSTTGLPATGITYTQITAAYARTRSVKVDITPATLASPSGAYTSGGFVEISNTTNPGIYRLDIPNAAFATGAYDVAVTIVPSGCRSVTRNFDLVDINNQVAYVPNAASSGIGGLLVASTAANIGSTDIKYINADSTAAANLAKSASAIVTGTVTSGASATSIPTSSISPVGSPADQFKGRIMIFLRDTATAALRAQATDITASSAAANPTFTVTALTTAPASGDVFVIV